MRGIFIHVGLVAITCVVISGSIRAAEPAFDSSASSAYDGGWNNGSNGGSGFGAWQISASGNGGSFTASSAANAGGSGGNINTAGRAWGLWSTNGVTEAVRAFTGDLSTGQTFRISFDNGYVDGGKSIGFALQNSAAQNLFEMYFPGGSRSYVVNGFGGSAASDIPFTGDGLDVEFNLTGPTSFFLRVYARVLGGSASTFYCYPGHLISQADVGVERFRVWNYEAGTDGNYDFFINNISVSNSTLWPETGDPLATSPFSRQIGAYARIYETSADLNAGTAKTTWSRGTTAQATPAYAGIQAVYSSPTFAYFRASGLGIHVMGPWYLDVNRTQNFPNFPVNTKTLWQIPRTWSLPASRILTGLGGIGFFVDGVTMFDSRDGQVWTGTAEQPNGAGYWNREAYVNEGVTFDPAYAHQEQTGTYHYHANPVALRCLLGDHVTFNPSNRSYAESSAPITNHSPILGWVRDGHPVYGPYGYSDPTNPASGVRRMISGFLLRDGQNGTDNVATNSRATLPAWAQRAYNVAANQDGPDVNGTYPLGRYMEDNLYRGDIGQTKGVDFDLDEYNGRFGVTPEFPNGTYAYFVSIASNGAPVYPYNIGRQFHGLTNGGVVTAITEPVTTNYLGGPAGQEELQSTAASGETVTLVWNSLEGGSYVIETSANMTNWTVAASNITATTNSALTTKMLAASGAGESQFQRIRRLSLAAYDDVFATGGGGGGGMTGNGITSVSPISANRSQTFTLTVNLQANPTPPLPPQEILPISIMIGGTAGTNLARPAQTQVTGLFTISAGAATGAQTVTVSFNTPGGTNRYTLVGGFTIN